jgi:hypothetical protein
LSRAVEPFKLFRTAQVFVACRFLESEFANEFDVAAALGGRRNRRRVSPTNHEIRLPK